MVLERLVSVLSSVLFFEILIFLDKKTRQKKRPWLFRQAQAALRGKFIAPDPTMLEQRECMLRHYDLVVDRFGTRKFRSVMARVANPEEFHAVVRDCFPCSESRS